MSTPNESSPRRGPTAEELLNAVADLPPDQAQAVLGRAQPAPADPDAYRRGRPIPEAGPPAYRSWDDYLARTNRSDLMAWCRAKAKKANAPRLMSEAPGDRLTGQDVWAIMEAAQGRCAYCGSLAVEKRPSTSTGQPLPWEHVGRRIGSLSHVVSRFDGGSNAADNLCWSCLWCNTWPDERRRGATDHGGVQLNGNLGIPDSSGQPLHDLVRLSPVSDQ